MFQPGLYQEYEPSLYQEQNTNELILEVQTLFRFISKRISKYPIELILEVPVRGDWKTSSRGLWFGT